MSRTSQSGTTSPDLSREISDLLRLSISSSAFTSANDYAAALAQFKGRIIALDGIPCAGKTYLGRALRDHFKEHGIDAVFLEEKMNKEHLGLFYSYMEKGVVPNPCSFSLQLGAMYECLKIYSDALWYTGRQDGGKARVVIIDRPVWGNRVFEQLQVKKGNISPEQHKVYESIVLSSGPYTFDYLIYLYVSPETAHHRIHNVRKTPEESGMPVEYLRELEEAYYHHLHRHLELNDRSLVVIGNEDAFCSPEGVLCIIKNRTKPPRPTRTVEELSRIPGEIGKVMRHLCKHYTEST